MNKFIQKNVDSGLLPEKVGEYIEEAIKNGESIIVAGHRSTGIAHSSQRSREQLN